jgi:general secretion pathway protein M
MKNVFVHLSRREKIVVVLSALFVSVFLAHIFIGRPLAQRLQFYQERLPAQQELLVWMEQASLEVQTIRGNRQGLSGAAGTQSPLTIISQSAKEQRLGTGIKRIEPGEGNEVRLWLEGVVFADMVPWLAMLQERFALAVGDISVERDKDPGFVNARVTFTGGQP